MSVIKTRSAYLNRIQINRECFLGFEFHLLAMGIYPRLIKCVWKGPPEAREDELNTSDGSFPNSFLRTSRGRNSPHSQHNRFRISLPLYLAPNTTVSPLPYMDTVRKKRWIHELQLGASFDLVVSGSNSKDTTSAQAARLAERLEWY